MLSKVKLALRITTNAYDDELNGLIEAAKLDLGIAGVIIPSELDAIVSLAIITYCKCHFGEPDEYDRLKASYDVDPGVDFVSKFKLNVSDEVFNEVMNPSTPSTDKKENLDFRRCGIEQVNAPLKFNKGKKVDSGAFVNYVDGDTTHVEAKNLGYTIKIRYLGIDTPESTSEIEKWGLTASYYSKYIYSGDESYLKYLDVTPEYAGITSLILVGQSASLNGDKMTLSDLKLGSNEQGTYYATADGNQRSLAYVWYATVDNPTKNDFRCLNLEMVYQGFLYFRQ